MYNYFTKKDGQLLFVFAVVASVLMSLVVGSMDVFVNAEPGTVAYWTAQIAYSLSIGLVAIVYAKVTKKNFVVCAKINHAPNFLHVLCVCLATTFLVFFSTPVNALFVQLLENLGLNRPSVDLPLQWPMLIVVVGIVAPVTEELLFRGAMTSGLADSNPWHAVLLSGLAFALFHMNPAQLLHQFVFGCVLAYAMLRSGSVWVPVIGHMFNNLLALLLMALNVETWIEQNVLLCIVVGAIGAGVVLFLYAKHTNWKCQSTKTEGEANVFFVLAMVFCAFIGALSLFVG